MRPTLFLLILLLLIFSVSCAKKRVIIRPLAIVTSEIQINDNEKATLQRITDKYSQCMEGTSFKVSDYHPGYLSIVSSFGTRTYHAKQVSSDSIKVYAVPPFDTLNKKEAELFRMGTLKEDGCPK